MLSFLFFRKDEIPTTEFAVYSCMARGSTTQAIYLAPRHKKKSHQITEPALPISFSDLNYKHQVIIFELVQQTRSWADTLKYAQQQHTEKIAALTALKASIATQHEQKENH
ncbi:hypothetical protein ACR782_05170 [Sphingobacterium spiritivorum]|uniref:hypothetical protein n=1 Tax=Sphingobacterium spiritivorum TaxID=258 RepID=UPI003DA60B1C